MNGKAPLIFIGLTGVCLLIAILVFWRQILWTAGALQVSAGPPQNAGMIVVVGGDFTGNRILKAAELAREGYAPRVLVSGLGSLYNFHESALAVDFAVMHGYSRELFIPFQYPAVSTADEARHVIAELRKRGVNKYLVVTSPNHTARAGRIFRRAAPDLELHVVAAEDPLWSKGYWWKQREGEKLWFMEEMKTIADAFGF